MIRRFDLVGFMLLTGLAAALIGGGIVLIDTCAIRGWELALIVSMGGALIAAAHPRAVPATPHNNAVHGAAQPASQDETLRAARGDTKAAALHHHTFKD